MNLFQRAYHGLTLTPGERAFLKLAQGIVIAALGAAFVAVAQYAAVGSVSNLTTVAQIGGVAFGVAVLNALHKYLSAQGDAPLADVAATLATNLGANLPKVPAVPVADPPTQLLPALPVITPTPAPAAPTDGTSQPAAVVAAPVAQ